MPIPQELIDAIAERVADIILDRLGSAPRISIVSPINPAAPSRVRGCGQPK